MAIGDDRFEQQQGIVARRRKAAETPLPLSELPPPPYHIHGMDMIYLLCRFAPETVAAGVPAPLVAAKSNWGVFAAYVAPEGYALAPFTAFYAGFEIDGFDGPDGFPCMYQHSAYYSGNGYRALAAHYNRDVRLGEARARVENGGVLAEGLVGGRLAVRLGGRLRSPVMEPKYGVNRYAAPSPRGGFGVFSVPFTCPHSELDDRFVEVIDTSLGLPVPVEVPWGIWCHGTSVTLGEPHAIADVAGVADDERAALELIEVFSRLGRAAMVIDAGRRVRRSNGPAARLIEAGRLPVRDSVFQPGEPGLGTLDGLAAWRGAMSDPLALRAGGETLLVQYMRLGPEETLVFADDPAVPGHAAPESALRLLGLTAHESRIAAMVGGGRSPREAAVELGLSPHTVRSALKVVFDKLGVGRQSELARVVMRLEAALPAPELGPLPVPPGE